MNVALPWYDDEHKKKQFMENLAPIVLFVYNRPEHTKKTVEALKNNIFANSSNLYIYSDASKNEEDEKNVTAVKEYLIKITGFKSVTIIERENNCGLANNIIDGVTDLVNKYGRVIVLEDDIVTSKYFLQYMNDALTIYESDKKVMQISGYMYPIDTDSFSETFFLPIISSWGWATWKDRWAFFEKNAAKIVKEFTNDDINNFNLDNTYDFWQQVLNNKNNFINTWAVFWYAAVFKRDGLVLYPQKSLVKNIGFDGSGVNCGVEKGMNREIFFDGAINYFSKDVKCHEEVFNLLKIFLVRKSNINLIMRVGNFLKRLFK